MYLRQIKNLAAAVEGEGHTLGFKDGCLPSTGTRSLVFVLHAFEHGRIFQHVWQDQEADLAATDVNLLQLRHPAIPVRHSDVGHLEEWRKYFNPLPTGSIGKLWGTAKSPGVLCVVFFF